MRSMVLVLLFVLAMASAVVLLGDTSPPGPVPVNEVPRDDSPEPPLTIQ